MINAKFSVQKIAIIGLDGTGACALDFASKTPVAEISLFVGNSFDQHNALRSSGAAFIAELDKHAKSRLFVGVYSLKYTNG